MVIWRDRIEYAIQYLPQTLPDVWQQFLPRQDSVTENIWFAPELPATPDPMNVGLRQYIRPLSGTAMVPGHDGLRAPRSS